MIFADLRTVFTSSKRSKLYLYHIDAPKDILHMLEVDAVISEDVSMSKEVTEYPIDTGEIYSDSAVRKPDEVTLSCVVSESPATYEDVIHKYNFELEGKYNYYTDKAKDFLTFSLFPQALLDIDISLGIFSNLSVTNVKYTASVETAGTLSFNITLKEVKFVASRMTDLPEMLEYKPGATMTGKGDGASINSAEPEVTKKDVDPVVEKEKRRTLWANLLKLMVETIEKYF